jgi:hypothetical protein
MSPTVQFAVDLGNCLCRKKIDCLCLWPVTDVLQLKIKSLGLKYSCVLCVWDNNVLLCSVLCS